MRLRRGNALTPTLNQPIGEGMSSALSMLLSLALTVVIECGLALLFRSKQLVYAVFLCNLLTNPPLNLLLMLYYTYIGRQYYWAAVAVLEICVFIAEALLLRLMMRYTAKRAFALSFLFNGCSFLIGLIIM